jgi:hypothetical protein
MPGLVPGITSYFLGGQDVDGRDKPGHDELKLSNFPIYGFSLAIATPSRAN